MFCTPTPTGRKETADKIAADTGGVIVHPYDNDDVIAGQVIDIIIVIAIIIMAAKISISFSQSISSVRSDVTS